MASNTLNVVQIDQKKYTLIEGLSQRMLDAIGQIEDTFTMIIYGDSGNGKTSLTVDLLTELKDVGSMLYISYEEGHGKTVQDMVRRHNLVEKLPNLKFSKGETSESLIKILKRKKSAKVVVIDSWQFSDFTIEDYKQLKKAFVFGKTPGKRKIFIFISHVNGRHPDGKSAIEIKRDANIKIHVEGFIGSVISRFGSKRNYLIWEQGAKQHWGKEFNKKLNKGFKMPKKLKNEPLLERKSNE